MSETEHYRNLCEKLKEANRRSYALICTIIPFVMLVILFFGGMFTLASFNYPTLFFTAVIANIVAFSANAATFLAAEHLQEIIWRDVIKNYSEKPNKLFIAGKGWLNNTYKILEIVSGVSLFCGLILTGVFYLFI